MFDGYWVLATDGVGAPHWIYARDGIESLRMWGAEAARRLDAAKRTGDAELLRVAAAGAAAGGFQLHEVLHSLNPLSAPVGIVLWAGPLTILCPGDRTIASECRGENSWQESCGGSTAVRA